MGCCDIILIAPEGKMIAVVGESLIDRVNGKELIGGCAFNAALAASRLGAPVTYFGKVSSDSYGMMILERMIDNGVLFDPILCNAPEPTLCSKAVLDKDGKATYVFDYKGTAASSLTKEELSMAFSSEGDIDMVFLGSISLLMEPGCDAIMPAIATIEKKPDKFLDVNARPSMVRDPDSYRKMILDLASDCELVRVSDEDLSYLFPGIDQLEAEKKLLNICKGSLIVTRGAEGSTWYQKGQKTFRVDAPCFKAGEVVDTIGCGDTFDGAVMAWLERNGFIGDIAGLERDDVSRILDYASKAAGLNCLFEGCNPPSRVGNADDME